MCVRVRVAGEEWIVRSLDASALLPQYGDRFVLRAAAVTVESVGINTAPSSRVINIKRVPVGAVNLCLRHAVEVIGVLRGAIRAPGHETATPASFDARVLPVKFKELGKRQRDFGDACELLGEVQWPDWPLDIRRTTRWFAKFVNEANTQPQSWMTQSDTIKIRN